ncbi:MAG: SAM-dependent methyltransferase [Aureispira sp.]|nr:SAM-dependent methyltransferase [Aureispira sp.]
MAGKIYLIPTPLGEDALQTIPKYVIDRIHTIDVWVVEKGKTARRFLKETKTPIPLQEMQFFELNRRTDLAEIEDFLLPAIQQNKNIGIVSEAGCPGIADPGAHLVQLAHNKGLEVVPFVGPSSILLALMASGMNGQRFAFQGYIPIKSPQLQKTLVQLEKESKQKQQTQLFIETPYRNQALIETILKTLNPKTHFCIAADLTLDTEYVKTQTIAQWRKTKLPNFHKRPALFLIHSY